MVCFRDVGNCGAEGSGETPCAQSWVLIIGGGLLPWVLVLWHFWPAVRWQGRFSEPVKVLRQMNAHMGVGCQACLQVVTQVMGSGQAIS